MSIVLSGTKAVTDEEEARNVAHAKSLGLPKVYFPPHYSNEKLAIVGGGHSVKERWDELRTFRHILAINATYKFLKNFGIDAAFVSVDPLPQVAEFAKGARKAILATRCHPSVFEALKGAQVRVFDTPGDVVMRTSTASTCAELALKMGFRTVTYFGCEGNYRGFSHADRHEDREVIKVKADGKEWITAPDYYFQALELADSIRSNPGIVCERSGGMLRAIVKDPKAEPIAIGTLCTG